MNQGNAIAYVGGKSGGHIVPALTLAQQETNKNNGTKILFFSTTNTLDKKIIGKSTLRLTHIPLPITKITYKNPFKLIFFFCSFVWSFFKSLYYLKKFRVQQIVSMGGLVSLPVCFAAKLLRIPIAVYELNAVPGKAVILLAKIATRIYVCFKEAKTFFPKNTCIFSPYPIRYSTDVLKISKENAPKKIGFSPHKKTVLILGGSQGSVFINTLIKRWITSCPEKAQNTQIIHQTGAYDTTDWDQFYAKKNIQAHFFTYQDDLSLYYQAADVVVCRSGAGTLFEGVFFKKPIITIPLQSETTTHQIDNAKALKNQYPNLIMVMDQNGLKVAPKGFFDYLESILINTSAILTSSKNPSTEINE